MDKPILSWYVKDGDVYKPSTDFYAGSYIQTETLKIPVRVWNNRYGMTEVLPAAHLRVLVYFENLEDSVLLPYVSVTVAGDEKGSSTITDNTATITFVRDVTLSGNANNGSENEFRDNWVDLEIELTVSDSSPRLKAHDVKSLIIEIESGS